jgi:hypothetical protein
LVDLANDETKTGLYACTSMIEEEGSDIYSERCLVGEFNKICLVNKKTRFNF